MDDWDDVFAKAAGHDDGCIRTTGSSTADRLSYISNDCNVIAVTTTTTTTKSKLNDSTECNASSITSNNNNNNKSGKKKRRRQLQQQHPNLDKNHYESYVTSGNSSSTNGSSTTTTTSDWFQFGESFPSLLSMNTTTPATTTITNSYSCSGYLPNNHNDRHHHHHYHMNQTMIKDSLLTKDEKESIDDNNNNDSNHQTIINTTTSSSSSPTGCCCCCCCCWKCYHPSGYHQMIIRQPPPTTSNAIDIVPLNACWLFVTIRNLRCYCRIQLNIYFNRSVQQQQQGQPMSTTFLETYCQELISILNRTSNSSSRSSHSTKTKQKGHSFVVVVPDVFVCDVTIRNVQLLLQFVQQPLISTIHRLQQQQQQQQHPCNNDDTNKIQHRLPPINHHYHDLLLQLQLQLIQCIMKCDAIYSRLYYNEQIQHVTTTTTTTTSTKHNHNTSPPSQYKKNHNKNSIQNHHRHEQPSSSSSRIPNPIVYYSEWSMFDRNKNSSSGIDTNTGTLDHIATTKENPLYRIYQYRMEETLSIFNENLVNQFQEQQQPSLLLRQQLRECKNEWDLSCRDDLCHIYCYATLSNAIIQDMILYLMHELQCYHMIEIGAGTGYLAYWMQLIGNQLYSSSSTTTTTTAKFHVSAFDIANAADTGTTNEYHADMAGYYFPVQYGESRKNCTDIFDHEVNRYSRRQNAAATGNNKHNNNDNANTALLLCYPPPDNEMGYNAIRNYDTTRTTSNNCTRKIIVHIGESNKGLTSTRRMEEYLLQHFQCIQRYPCHLYGSVDASYIAIWVDTKSCCTTTTTTSGKALTTTMLLPCSYCHVKEGKRRCIYLRSLVYCSKPCFQKYISTVALSKQQQQRPSQHRSDTKDDLTSVQEQNHWLLCKIIQIDQLDFLNIEHFEQLYDTVTL